MAKTSSYMREYRARLKAKAQAAAAKSVGELSDKEIEEQMQKYGGIMESTAYGHTAYLQNDPDGSKKEHDAYREARDKYQELKAEKSKRAWASAKTTTEPKKPKKRVNGYGEATDREITTTTYERAQKNLQREVDSWFGMR